MKVIRSVSRIIFITSVSDEGHSRNVSYAYTELNIYECLGQILLDYLAFQSFDWSYRWAGARDTQWSTRGIDPVILIEKNGDI
jgi:hypothetical protein